MPNFSLTQISTTHASIKNLMDTLGPQFFDTKDGKFDEDFIHKSQEDGALYINSTELETYVQIQINIKKRKNGKESSFIRKFIPCTD